MKRTFVRTRGHLELNNGFTLVELLAVIVILSLIMLIVLPRIVNSVKNHSKDVDEISKKLIYNATELYIENNKRDYKELEGNVYCISIRKLIDTGLLKEPVTLSDKKDISNTKVVEVTYKNGYKYNLKETNECVEEFINSEIIINKLEPVLGNLTPVIYKDNNWLVADTSLVWYNYKKQEWANAVLLTESGKKKAIGQTLDIEKDVIGMFVWIPRYEYKIVGQYGTHTDGTPGTQALPGEIEVKFIPREKTEADSGYIIHSAFWWDDDNNGIETIDEELTGIWVGKFETTGDATNPTILPNLSSLRDQNISAQFATSRLFETKYGISFDSHMAKNSEWGAVAYLSQSKYGKYGNINYTGTNKEVYINNSSGYYTGRSGGTPNASDSITGTCTYDNMNLTTNETENLCGEGASTTGNITGVYDMNGGAWEYVMSYLEGNYAVSGFSSTNMPDSRYYDAYKSQNPSSYNASLSATACNNGICYGHALSETSRWYGDQAAFVGSGSSWTRRGGRSNGTSSAGVFDSDAGGGNAYTYYVFRLVLVAT